MKNRIYKSVNIDIISLDDVVEKYNLNDSENILTTTQGLADAIVQLAQAGKEHEEAIASVAKALSLYLDLARVDW